MCCDKSGGMKILRIARVVAAMIVLVGCSGGGSESTTTPGAAWPKFRRDVNNSGAGGGIVVSTATPHVLWSVAIDAVATATPTPPAGTPAAPQSAGTTEIISSPAIGIDGALYIGSQNGTLAAINSNGTVRWRVTECACAGAAPTPIPEPLGSIISSPAVVTANNITNIFIGSVATDTAP